MVRQYFLMSMVALGLLTLAACTPPGQEPQVEVLEGHIFGAPFQISIGAQHDVDQEVLEEDIMAVLNEVDRQMSTYRDDSVLNEINTAPLGEPVEVPDELFYVLQVGYEVANHSGGAFDYTVGGLVNLWGFGPEGRIETAPDETKLTERLAEVGFDAVELDAEAQTVTRQRDVFVDLSGIAKGYGADAVSQLLHELGLVNHLINLGGDLVAAGQRDSERQWRIGIEAPNAGQQVVQHILPLTDIAMVGSGDYRNYFEEDGVRYSHTIDPTTGRPIEHALAAVHVTADHATLADAWATAFMVLGEEQGVVAANEHDVSALFIFRSDEGFESVASERFEREHSDDLKVPTVQ